MEMLVYDSVFEVIYRLKERDRRLQMADSRALVLMFGRGSRLLAIARLMPRQTKTFHWSRAPACDARCWRCLLHRAKAALENAGKEVLGRASSSASFACIFMLIPLFRPTSIPFYTLSIQILAK